MPDAKRWRRDIADLVADHVTEVALDAVGAELLARWSQPHRRYHTLAHLADVLSTVDEYAAHATAPSLVRLAAWLHDAVYDSRAAPGANEEASAALGHRLLDRLGCPGDARREIARLVRLTARHDPVPGDRDGELLCDADLAVLARPAAEYDRYAAAIRQEYAHLPDAAFRAGRAAVLHHLLALPRLYRIPQLNAQWAEQATANLRRELAQLHADIVQRQ